MTHEIILHELQNMQELENTRYNNETNFKTEAAHRWHQLKICEKILKEIVAKYEPKDDLHK